MKLFGRKPDIVNTNEAKIDELLSRGVEDVFVKESLKKKLLSGKVLRIKLGIDPTSASIHLGRATLLHKLRKFQDLGHKAVLIVGDFTAQIGDPSDKLEKRPMLDSAKITENLKNYKEIIGKIINVERAEFVYNGDWLSKLGFVEVCRLAETFSVQQMMARRNFKERFDKGEEVSLREFMYPLMQGYDSVAVQADIEIGGFDQLFNLKAGRVIQKQYGMPEQDVLTTQMLEGTDGRKMSSSWGNVINITDAPNEMFGKVMSLRDELITKYFLLCTNVSAKEISEIEASLKAGDNPRNFKVCLAKEIVALYHGNAFAEAAVINFENTFKKGGIPDDTQEVEVVLGTALVEVLLANGIVKSKTEFRRLVSEGAVGEVGGETISGAEFAVTKDLTLKIGKKRFLKVRVK
ncbi:tyrosine--tRNA ligase [Patescibacteria group bacterium]|nr:MAG: tyrosine--tRNA ligase [Patescibacteria group bacterium]